MITTHLWSLSTGLPGRWDKAPFEPASVPQPSTFRISLVLFLVLSIVSAEIVLLFNPTARGWPFASIHVFRSPGEYQHESYELYVWGENGEQTLIEAGLVRYNVQTSLLHHARPFEDPRTLATVSAFLKKQAKAQGRAFQGFRIYRVVWDLREKKKTQRELVHEEVW